MTDDEVTFLPAEDVRRWAADLDAQLAENPPAEESAVTVAPSKAKCRRHQWARDWDLPGAEDRCVSCGALKDPVASRRSRNNRKRGNAAELDVARGVGGRKVGPLGHPWDVEMTGYSRLSVKKLATPPSLRFVANELARIAAAPGPEMPGFCWIEPGRGGERLIVFRMRDFADRHGTPTGDEDGVVE
jgi:hypothetical protein